VNRYGAKDGPKPKRGAKLNGLADNACPVDKKFDFKGFFDTNKEIPLLLVIKIWHGKCLLSSLTSSYMNVFDFFWANTL
jgi:hypothetical protein